MASEADRRRRRRARTISRTEAVNADRAAGPKPAPKPKPTVANDVGGPRDSGLDFLFQKQRITKRQRDTGRAYGVLYRAALIGGDVSLKSCLDQTPRGGGVGVPSTDLDTGEWIAECKRRLAEAQLALGLHSGLIATLDLICGRGFRPREITTVQRESEEIETALRVALDLLRRHFDAAEVLARGGPAA